MSTDRIQEWLKTLPEDKRAILAQHIKDITEIMDQIVVREETLNSLVKKLADQIAEWIGDLSMISSYLKHILKGIVSDDTIERACGIERKQRRNRYQQLENPQARQDDDKKTIEVSSSGSESITGSDGKEKENEKEDVYTNPVAAANPLSENTSDDKAERSAEIALTTVEILKRDNQELMTRLDEALKLADDKEKRIDELKMQYANMEVELGDLKNSPIPAPPSSSIVDLLSIENDRLKAELKELREVEAIHTRQQDFKPASSVAPSIGKQIWIAAINVLSLYSKLNPARKWAIEHNDPWRKLIFEIAEDGQVKGAELEPKN